MKSPAHWRSSRKNAERLKWAIVHSHPHSAARSKQASTEAILDGRAKLEFSGMVQVQEHSSSKCHVEAKHFWQKENPEAEKSTTKKIQEKKTKFIPDDFRKPENPLN